MTLHDYWRIIRRNWILVLTPALLLAALMGGRAALGPAAYSATAEVYVFATGEDVDPDALAGLDSYVLDQIPFYTALAGTPEVAQAVAERTEGTLSPEQVNGKLSASSSEGSTAIVLNAVDADPDFAIRLANVGAEELKDAIEQGFSPQMGSELLVQAEVVRPAEPPATRVSQSPKRATALGLLIGLGVGAVALALRESLRKRFPGSRDVELAYGVPVLGVVPAGNADSLGPGAMTGDLSPETLAAYRRLRANLPSAAKGSGVSVAIIPVGQSPKASMVARDLALVAADAGFSVCLVDAGFDSSQPNGVFETSKGDGLGEVLGDQTDPNRAMQFVRDGRVALLPSGSSVTDPDGLLSSKAMGDLADRLESEFDYTIFSVPAMPDSIGSAVLSQQVTGAVVVIDSQESLKAQLAAVFDQLRKVQATLLGVVWAEPEGGR